MNKKRPPRTNVKLKKAADRSGGTDKRSVNKAKRASSRKKKQFNPTPLIFAAIVIIGGGLAYGPIMKFIEESNRPKEVKVVKREAPKKKKKVVKKEAPKPVVQEIKKIEAPKEVLFAGELKHYTFAGIVNDRCISCHGQEGNEVEGKFDFVKVLASGTTNPKLWRIIHDEIAEGNMPPDDEEPLSSEEKEVLLAEIKKITANTITANKTRALTPNEIENTLSDLFQVDKNVYNPFGKLYSNYSHTDFYTVQENIITPYYLSDLYTSLEDAVKSYVSLRTRTKPLNVGVNFPTQIHRTFKNGSMTDLRWYHGDLMNEIRFNNREAKEEKKSSRSRKSSRNEKSEGPDTETEELLAKLTLPAGTYMLSFTGEALNMNPDKYNKEKYGQTVIDYYKNLLPKDGYGLPVDFFIVPPGKADAYSKVQHITSIKISQGKERYTVQFTLNRKGAIAYRMGMKKFPKDTKVAAMVASHRFKNTERKAVEKSLAQDMRVAKYPFAQVRFSNISIKGPLNVKVNGYSLKDDERLTDRAIREKFKNLHEDAAIKNNTVYSYIFSKLKQSRMDEEESYRTAMMSFFLSPDFLTVGNDKKDKQAYARYVSYALHKSHPSPDFITQFENAQRAKNSEKLTDWIVNHSNFRRFLENFSYQWLEMEEILAATPEADKFGTFHKKNFFDAYQEEISKFLLHLFTQNRPIKELVTADYSFVNDDLRDFYENGGGNSYFRYQGKVPEKYDIQKDTFKKHTFSDKRRGGLLSSGAFLTATGNGVDGLPIKRSTWILDNLLDSPLPPPPDEIDLTNFESKHSEDLKTKLEAHSKDPSCYNCHKRIDPFAIIMDYFDTMGGIHQNHSRDAVMINTHKIKNVGDLKEYIGSQEEVLARSFTKQLLRYTLGRDLYIQDGPKIDKIVEENRDNGFKTRELLNSVIKNFFL